MSRKRVSVALAVLATSALACAASCGSSSSGGNDAGSIPSGSSGSGGGSSSGGSSSGSQMSTGSSSGSGGSGSSGSNGGSSSGSSSNGSGGGSGGSSGASSSSGGSSSGGSSSGGSSSGSSSSGGSSSGGTTIDGGRSEAGSEGGVSEGGAPEGGSSDGGNCAGMAISFNLNVPTANDPAAQRVMADLASDLPLGNAVRTIEWWAYVLPTSWKGDSNTMFEYGDQVVTNGGFGFDFGTNQSPTMGTIDPYTNGTFDDDNQPSGIANPGTAQWIHFALSWDGTTLRAFVNGVQEVAKAAGGMLSTDRTQLTIGGNPRGAYFNGNIDEFRVWNVARSATDIMSTMHKTLVGDEAGLVGYWKFDETMGMTAADSTTTAGHTAHPGTLMSATGSALPQWIPSTAPIDCP